MIGIYDLVKNYCKHRYGDKLPFGCGHGDYENRFPIQKFCTPENASQCPAVKEFEVSAHDGVEYLFRKMEEAHKKVDEAKHFNLKNETNRNG
jgi:hypothetical protein